MECNSYDTIKRTSKKRFGMGGSMKNYADALIFHMAICVEVSQIGP